MSSPSAYVAAQPLCRSGPHFTSQPPVAPGGTPDITVSHDQPRRRGPRYHEIAAARVVTLTFSSSSLLPPIRRGHSHVAGAPDITSRPMISRRRGPSSHTAPIIISRRSPQQPTALSNSQIQKFGFFNGCKIWRGKFEKTSNGTKKWGVISSIWGKAIEKALDSRFWSRSSFPREIVRLPWL
jgi:hypothetical protein